MKKYAIIFILFTCVAFAQNDYVDVDNSVYNFLERMDALHIINGYNSLELPKPRKDVVKYLKEVIASQEKLDATDRQILQDLKIEFEYELFGTLNNSQSMIGHESYDLFSQKAKYLYYYTEPGRADLFVNLIGEGEGIFKNDFQYHNNLSTTLGVIGGEIKGSFLNHFGFSLTATNGNVFGNKEVAALRDDIRQNFKFNERSNEAFFDETEGYLTADFDMLRVKFGRDRVRIGYGPMKSIIDDYAPAFDYLGFNINYKFFTYSYFHGKLLGETVFQPDSISGGINQVGEKYIGYHRIGFDISDELNIGAGEMIIYGDRSLDFSYLNPFAFYKSIEHANQDRDNSFLFFDVSDKSIKGMKIFGTLLIDDIDFSKIGTGWYGNETLWDLGVFSSNLYNIIPADLTFEYTMISPYVHTHRTGSSNFTNNGYDLGSSLKPNSELFLGEITYRLNYRTNIDLSFKYILHGANPVLPDGTIINVGGDETLGHRTFDSNNSKLLNGDMEYSRITSASLTYEPVKQYFIIFKLAYLNESLQNSVITNQLQSYLTLSVKL
ncbi:MAG: hypothetical protein P4L45_02570 [Ignavibacteriaceae bacterium]|nr:hypothetical protein [Ignavibacteriaceae bacterium]